MSKSQHKILDVGDSRGPTFAFKLDGLTQEAHKTWFRGEDCHYNPAHENLQSAESIHDHVLAGWAPSAPGITPETNIVAFGSCFAEHISKWLARRDFNILNKKDGVFGETYIARFGEGMANSYAVLQQFEWALEDKPFTEELWHDKDAILQHCNEEVRLQTKAALLACNFFIITLGLSEVWADKISGNVFWRAIPEDDYDPDRHEFRVSTHAENLENLRQIHRLIRKHNPDAKIMFTLSPVPLVATFRPVSCITANSASKAILRAALDEFLREAQPTDANLHYWPSYEIVLDVFNNRWLEDRRHVKTRILDYVMTAFEHVWCTGTPQMGLNQAWLRARCATGDLQRNIYPMLARRRFDELDKIIPRLSPVIQQMVAQARQEMSERAAFEPDSV